LIRVLKIPKRDLSVKLGKWGGVRMPSLGKKVAGGEGW